MLYDTRHPGRMLIVTYIDCFSAGQDGAREIEIHGKYTGGHLRPKNQVEDRSAEPLNNPLLSPI